MTKEDEEFMLDNFVTFFIAGESVLFLLGKRKFYKIWLTTQKRPKEVEHNIWIRYVDYPPV